MGSNGYRDKWNRCQRCPLHKGARRHVVYRGSVPAEILFVGEAPGKTEDKLGRPFVGQAGCIFKEMVRDLCLARYCVTNVVCCIPWLNPARRGERDPLRVPTPQEAAACFPHLEELVALCRPKLLVALGNEADRCLGPLRKGEYAYVKLLHPSYINRRGGVGTFEYKNTLRLLESKLLELGLRQESIFVPAHPDLV